MPRRCGARKSTALYQYVALSSQAHNTTISGGHKYNIPSGNITLEGPLKGEPRPNMTMYSEYAISGADDFSDGSVTVKEVFDFVVNTTREITPTCELSNVLKPAPLRCVDPCSRSSRSYLGTWACGESTIPWGYLTLFTPFSTFWLVSPVEKLPPTALSSSSIWFLSSEISFVHSALIVFRVLTTRVSSSTPSPRS
jgi:hypothetical protein